MSLAEKVELHVPFPLEKSSFHSPKVKNPFDGFETEQKPMIGIYLVGQNRFSYLNEGLRKLLGKYSNEPPFEGWDSWFLLIDSKNVAYVKNQIANFFSSPYLQNLLSLNYLIHDNHGRKIRIKHEIIMHRFEQHLVAVNFFLSALEKEKKDYFFKASSRLKAYQTQKKANLKISPREKEVLDLIGNGFSSKEIADMLFISNHTAISHRKNLIEKFHVRNTAHLIKKASELIPSF